MRFRHKPFMRFIFAATVIFANPSVAREAEGQKPSLKLAGVKGFNSGRTPRMTNFAFSPDGAFFSYYEMALASEVSGPPPSPILWVKDKSSKRPVRVPGEFPGDEFSFGGPFAVWSPDGKRLAYLIKGRGSKCHLAVWNRETGDYSVQTATDLEVGWGIPLRWSPDGSTVYFLGRSGTESSSAEAPIPSGMSIEELYMRTDGRVLLKDKLNNGITMMESGPGEGKSALDRESADLAASIIPDVNVVAYDIGTQTSKILIRTSYVRSIDLSPDGSKLLVTIEAGQDPLTRQFAQAFFVLPTKGELSGDMLLAHEPNSIYGKARDEKGRFIRPLVARAKLYSDANQSWAPTSDRIAWAEIGATADGDVMVVDIVTGQVRNLTKGTSLPTDARDVGSLKKTYARWHGKFGPDMETLVWSPDGKTIYARHYRTVPKEYDVFGSRADIWAISAADGSARNLTEKSDFSVSEVITHNGTVWNGGNGNDLLAAVRFSDNRSGFVRINPLKGVSTTLAKFTGVATYRSGRPDYTVASRGSKLAFTNDGPGMPPELYTFDTRTTHIAEVTQMNKGVADTLPYKGVHRVFWRGTEGDLVSGRLYLPRNPRPEDGGKSPVVLSIYPDPRAAMMRPEPYGAVSQSEGLSVLRAGYALFIPSLAVRGNGSACQEITASTLAALDAVARSGLVDANRAAVMGSSHGGYSVNCVVTHTGRFNAAIEISGYSNLFILDLEKGGTSGGQAMIGDEAPESPAMIEKYLADSPLYHAGQVTTPLLLLHGKVDTTVPFTQSLWMYRAIQRAGRATVRLVGYDGMGHGFSPAGQPDLYKQIIAWLDRFLRKGPAPLRAVN